MDELIKALRYCGNFVDRDGCDEECPYFNDKDCPKRIMHDAADALKAADKRINELTTKCNQLQAQMPKRGEWINPSRNPEYVNKTFFSDCSVCGHVSMDESNYCPNCGARMRKGEKNNG
jgi:RNA polymerase subunit RPABC4/transcription elongation factor Spt4